MTFEAIQRELSKKIYHPIYFLYGEESYYLDEISNHIEHKVLQEHEKDFNLSVLYGKDSSAQDVIEAARRTPMMSDYQVVMLKEAQALNDIDDLLSYFQNPVKSTILCIVYRKDKLDKRKKVFKDLLKSAVVLESKPLNDNQIAPWVKSFLGNEGFDIEQEAADMIAEYMGNQLARISNELKKLMLRMGKPAKLTLKDIQDNVGISKDYNIFEFSKALGDRDVKKVFKIAKHFGLNSKTHNIIPTLGFLNRYFSQVYLAHFVAQAPDREAAAFIGCGQNFVYQYRTAAKNYSIPNLEKVFEVLQEYDLKSKGVNNSSVEDLELYKELSYRLLN
jgi:DNA polymerase-3 subunit delta